MLITLADYRRIYSTIHSLLLADSVNSHEASMLFSVYGAQILKLGTHIIKGRLGALFYDFGGRTQEGQVNSVPSPIRVLLVLVPPQRVRRFVIAASSI